MQCPIFLILLSFPFSISGDFLTDYFRQRSHLGNDKIYDYYDNVVPNPFFGSSDKVEESEPIEHIRSMETGEDSLDVCSLDPGKVFMICRCENSLTHVTCMVFKPIPSESPVWDAFAELVALKRLHFSTRPHEQEFMVPPRVLQYLPNLETVIIRHTKIPVVASNAFSHLPELQNIELDNNIIEDLERKSFNSLANLRDLSLSENYLSHIRAFTFVDLPMLTILYLDRNNIVTIAAHSFIDLKNLRELELWGNSLESVSMETFRGLNELTVLDLGSNNLQKIFNGTFSSMPQLVRLYLHNNKISFLEAGAFDGLVHLNLLHLQENQMTTISESSFQNLPNLMIFDVSNNLLEVLTSSFVMNLHNIHNRSALLYVKGNPFVCNCSLFWMHQMLDGNITTNLREELQQVTCRTENKQSDKIKAAESLAIRGINITHLTWNEMKCEDKMAEMKSLNREINEKISVDEEELANTIAAKEEVTSKRPVVQAVTVEVISDAKSEDKVERTTEEKTNAKLEVEKENKQRDQPEAIPKSLNNFSQRYLPNIVIQLCCFFSSLFLFKVNF